MREKRRNFTILFAGFKREKGCPRLKLFKCNILYLYIRMLNERPQNTERDLFKWSENLL